MSEDVGNNMKDSWFFEKNFNGLSDEAFDDVFSFLDFPLEDVEPNVVEEDWDAQFKRIEPCYDVFSVSSTVLCSDKTQNEKPQLGGSFSGSSNEVSPIKQLDETAGLDVGKTILNQNSSLNGKDLHQLRTYSPVSVFESSSTSSAENSNLDLPAIPVKRARSKRQRASSFSPLFVIPSVPTSPAWQIYEMKVDPESNLGTHHAGKSLNNTKKQRKRDLPVLSGHNDMKRSSSQEPVPTRKCMHCEVTKTPQWREGPMGPKTLCNACGVRYRSGRLFPEYRPAASPTFVPSVHSNCHKKVIEMRSKGIQASLRNPLSAMSNLHGNSVG
ncbi:GATA transcription factor 11 [Arachis duranensis]|uniref:GATA transcription factor 11 n=1 Tax=Arachis duranensis TaxID=130453 RepID=A0A6P4C1R3_ARADU|nr:GATA transcription factor 11 [Arachis duranensis]